MAEAPVTKVTFYRHYASKEAVLDAIREDLVVEMKTNLESVTDKSLAGGILVFLRMMESADAAYRRLFKDEEYEDFRRKLREEFFSQDYFVKMCQEQAYAEIVPAFISDAVSGIYLRWRTENIDNLNLKELADRAARLIYSGLGTIRD